MSREIIERLEEILPLIPKRYRPKIKDDNIFDDECYIELDHNTYTKITVDINMIVLHRHNGLWGMFGHPPDRIRMFTTCDDNNWQDELVEFLNG